MFHVLSLVGNHRISRFMSDILQDQTNWLASKTKMLIKLSWNKLVWTTGFDWRTKVFFSLNRWVRNDTGPESANENSEYFNMRTNSHWRTLLSCFFFCHETKMFIKQMFPFNYLHPKIASKNCIQKFASVILSMDFHAK